MDINNVFTGPVIKIRKMGNYLDISAPGEPWKEIRPILDKYKAKPENKGGGLVFQHFSSQD